MIRPQVATCGVLAALLLAAQPVWALDEPLAEARALYAAGSYARSLQVLAKVEEPAQLDAADQYRALCLLALRKPLEAERVIERLVLRNPLSDESLQIHSVKFIEIYQVVRLRLVPKLASASYAAAKASLDSKDYDTAIRQFEETLELIRSAEDRHALSDLELVASEFRALAGLRASAERLAPVSGLPVEPAPVAMLDTSAMPAPAMETPPASTRATDDTDAVELAEAGEEPGSPMVHARTATVIDTPTIDLASAGVPAAASEPAPPSLQVSLPVPAAAPRPFLPVPRVHDFTDEDVVPPTVLRQTLPAWNPPWPQIRNRTFNGRLEIVVAEDGTVDEAEVVQSSFAAYDDELLRAVNEWRYEPARKGDRPVRYRRVIDFVLRGQDSVSQRR
jgi:TonB family protein